MIRGTPYDERIYGAEKSRMGYPRASGGTGSERNLLDGKGQNRRIRLDRYFQMQGSVWKYKGMLEIFSVR